VENVDNPSGCPSDVDNLLSTERHYPQSIFSFGYGRLPDKGGLTMPYSLEAPKIKVVKFRLPKTCICPDCGVKQPFKSAGHYWKIVKDLDIDQPRQLKVRVVRAKCLNSDCRRKKFSSPIPGIEKYARSTARLKSEAISGIVDDNSTAPRISKRLNRCFNTSGSQWSIYRWKQREANKYDIKDIIAKLEFSGILTLDEYKPKRSDSYSLIAGDALKQRILYMEPVPGLFGRGEVKRFLEKLKQFGLKPWAIIFDLWAAFPRQVRKVWPQIIIQYDYFHVMQWIHKYLKNALLQFRRELKEKSLEDMRSEIWEHKWRLLKNMDKWTPEDHQIIQDLIQVYTGTIVEKILLFKEQLYQIFDLSSSKEEAYAKRDALFQEGWWQNSWHLSQAMKFLMSDKFEYMITYLGDSRVPRSGNLENLNSVWRQIESARFGFKTDKGRLDHLKLYQISKYLQGNFP
jgi:transposase